MDLRALKKRCREAADILVAKHGFSRSAFVVADGSEAIDAPHDLEARFVDGNWIHPGVLKGTLLYSYQSNYECDECDVKLPTEVLADIEYAEKMSDDDWRQLANA
jgi:hypothetical protein